MKLFWRFLVATVSLVLCYELSQCDSEPKPTQELNPVTGGGSLTNALRDVAYSLRHHKFNEWDRRFGEEASKTANFFKDFPRLRSIQWEVYENCYNNFYECLHYLHSIIKTAPFTRNDDIITAINKNTSMYNTMKSTANDACIKALKYSEKTGLPFDGPKEKFLWQTSASYYMCWYTMLGVPELAMLGEPCNNFARCLDPIFGYKNNDARADDKIPFACAMYSFCPDPCCPIKHIETLAQCHNSKENPCFIENSRSANIKRKECHFDRSKNINFDDMVANRWNISCACNLKGFEWKSEFGMCIDINECVTGSNNCDTNTENCLNTPGSHRCICKWGYQKDKHTKKCVEKMILVEKPSKINTRCDYWGHISNFLQYIGL